MLIIKIQNDGTGTVTVGNYRYQVMINDSVIESGNVIAHKRRLGWKQLLIDLISASEQQREFEAFSGLFSSEDTDVDR